jgi:anti-sigma factor RsiW
MKPSEFEEMFTAWVDGKLEEEEAGRFEVEMRARGFDPELEREAAQSVTQLLRLHASAPELPHADFFQHRLMNRARTEAGDTQDEAPSAARRKWLTWRLPRLAWAGAFALIIAATLFYSTIPHPRNGAADVQPYFATVVDVRTFEPTVSASTVYQPGDNVTVLWLEGLEFLPADYALQ